ncbi:unnamed protein product [Oikopleura dioica]|uniref:ribonuclease H n=1 Tax=Oikopleura dioica TaxID=34765 RepID=E4Y8Q7_OIKDI|nr:unnamed protein product [Oikopleura dioica]
MSNPGRNPFEHSRGYQPFVYSDGSPPPKLSSDIEPSLAAEFYECWLLQFERYCSKLINTRSKNSNPYAMHSLDLCCLWERPEGLNNPNWQGPISVPGSLAEFQQWKATNPARYAGKGDVEHLVVRQGVVGLELGFNTPPNHPNPPMNQGDIEKVFLRIFFPGWIDFDSCFNEENLLNVRTATAVAGGTFIALSQSQDKQFIRKGELLNARTYIQELIKLVEDPVKKPEFFKVFAVLRTFSDPAYNRFSIKSKMDLVRDVVCDNLKDHSTSPITIGHNFSRTTFREQDRWSPFLELSTFLLSIAACSESELAKVLESLSEKTNSEYGDMDISTVLNNMKFIISQFIRNNGGSELPVLCPEKWSHAYIKNPEKPITAYKSICDQQELAMKKEERPKDKFHAFGQKKTGQEKKRFGPPTKHVVNEINSSEVLFTDPRTGRTFKEIKSLKVPKEEVVRVKAHKLIYVSTTRPTTKFKQRINKAVKGLGNKTFHSKKPKAGNYRALDFGEVHRELDLILRMQDEDEEEEGDNAFITEDMALYEKDDSSVEEDDFDQILDNSSTEGLSNLTENKNNLQFRLIEEAAPARVQPVDSNLASPGNVYAKFKFSSLSNGVKVNKVYRLIFDTGATSSLLPYCFYDQLYSCNAVTKQEDNTITGAGAAGIKLDLCNFRVSCDLEFGKLRLSINEAAVHRGSDESTILFGMRDWQANRVEFSNDRGLGLELKICGELLAEIWKPTGTILNRFDPFFTLSESFKKFLNKSEIDEISVRSPLDPKNEISSIVFDMKPTERRDPSGMRQLKRELEVIHEENKAANTIDDVTIDGNNEVLDLSLKEDVEFLKAIKLVLYRYKEVFSKTIGCVPGDEYVVQGKIEGTTTGKFMKDPYEGVAPAVLDLITKKMNQELAEGVLKVLPSGMIPKNKMRLFPVAKKDSPGMTVQEKAINIRLVSDCSRGINENTKFISQEMDSIKDSVQKIAGYSESGLIGCCDLSQMFFSFRLAKDLWSNFCVHHPHVGTCVYTRLPMGWVCSPSCSKDFLSKIYYPCKDFLARYVDDLCFGGNTRQEFLQNLELIMKITYTMNLRFSGKKMNLLSKNLKILGKRIHNGMIAADEHIVQQIVSESIENLDTVRKLRGLLGKIAFISDCLPSRVEITSRLSEATGGKLPKDKIDWTDELKKDFETLKTVVNGQLVNLYPIAPNLETIVVVDSSYIATGGFLLQIKDGKRRLVKLFSRRRSDAANKVAFSSCLLELTGLVAAAKFFKVEMQMAKTKVRFYTDSHSVEKLYLRLSRGESLSDDLRINAHLLELLNHDLEVVYLSNKDPFIVLADHISRTTEIVQECKGNCKVCNAADCIVIKTEDIPRAKNLKEEFKISGSFGLVEHMVPNVSIEEYNAIQLVSDDNVWWDLQYSAFKKDHFFPFEGEEFNFSVTRANPAVARDFPELEKLKLTEVLKSHELLRRIQLTDKRLRDTVKAIELEILPNNKGRPVETARWKYCVRNGVVVSKKNVGIRQIYVTTIPERLTYWFAHRIHKEFGCSSLNGLIKEASTLVEAPKIKDAFKAIMGRCKKCSFHRVLPNIFNPLKEYNDFNPSEIGEVFSWDQISRLSELNNRKMIKFWVLTDHLTAYTTLHVVEGPDSKSNRDSLIAALKKLHPNRVGRKDIRVIMDSARVNTPLVNEPELSHLKIKVKCMSAHSRSKNNLSILDTRVAKLTKYLTLAINELKDAYLIAERVSNEHNRLRGTHGFSPKELVTGKDQFSETSIEIDWKTLINMRRAARELSRRANEKMLKAGRFRVPMNLRPYSEGDTYGGTTESPIKLNDIVLVSGIFDKNNSRPFYRIVANDDFPEGIDFENQLIHTTKMDVKRKNKASLKTWSFNCIRCVIDGESKDELPEIENEMFDLMYFEL